MLLQTNFKQVEILRPTVYAFPTIPYCVSKIIETVDTTVLKPKDWHNHFRRLKLPSTHLFTFWLDLILFKLTFIFHSFHIFCSLKFSRLVFTIFHEIPLVELILKIC